MTNTVKSRVERLEHQYHAAGEPFIVKIVHFTPFKEGRGILVEGRFHAAPDGASLEELKKRVIDDLMRSGPRSLIVVEQYVSEQ